MTNESIYMMQFICSVVLVFIVGYFVLFFGKKNDLELQKLKEDLKDVSENLDALYKIHADTRRMVIELRHTLLEDEARNEQTENIPE